MKKKIIILIIVLISSFTFSACVGKDIREFYINRVLDVNLSVGEDYYFQSEGYVSSNEEVFVIDDNVGHALTEGEVFISKEGSNIYLLRINIIERPTYITISGENWIKPNSETMLHSVVSPISASQEVTYSSSDEEIISVNSNGLVTSHDKMGFAYVTVRSVIDDEVFAKYPILVEEDDEKKYDTILEYDHVTSSNTISPYDDMLGAFINNLKSSLVGIVRYDLTLSNKEKETEFGSGMIYRKDVILEDGSILENVSDDSEIEGIAKFKYYCITTRYLTKDASSIKVYLGEDYAPISANLIEYDDKIDLAVVTFTSTLYFKPLNLGNSDEIEQGEMIISIGNSYGKTYFRSATFGVISHPKRYISTDTDNDDVSDWDSEYLQHDAPINTGDNGGIVINLKGEVIGINDTKITSLTSNYNCMSLAIPSNLVKDIVSMLENGEKPRRPILGVSIFDVRAYYQNKDYYHMYYPDVVIPDGLDYGFYVNEVEEDGVAKAAGVLKGDILLEFNGVNTKYSYMLRAELGKFIYGSGEQAELKVLRNGEVISLYVTF